MNREQAAEALGVSVRTLNKWVGQGLLNVSYAPGKTRSVAIFDDVEVEELKAKREQATANFAVAEVLDEESGTAKPGTGNREIGNHETGNRGSGAGDRAALVRHRDESRNANQQGAIPVSQFVILSSDQLGELVGAMRATETPRDTTFVTFAEAARMFGVSERALRTAQKAGAFPACRIGRSDRVRSADVREWMDRQFS